MARMQRSNHNLSHSRLTTFDMGQLVPIACLEVLMGDSFVHATSVLLRAATLVTPVMHPVEVRVHHWYVPNRILWTEWDAFITGRDPEAVMPTVTIADATPGPATDYTLADHFGLPNDCGPVSALPFVAYSRIWNEYYRDQNVQTERQGALIIGNAGDVTSGMDLSLARVGWGKDYFTTARPDPQQGSSVSIPFEPGALAPIRGLNMLIAGSAAAAQSDGQQVGVQADMDLGTGDFAFDVGETAPSDQRLRIQAEASGAASDSNRPQIFADLGGVSGGGIDINEFRQAMALQRHLEARNRFGSRIQDYLNYHGIRPRDGRLDIPEYLGGGKATIAFSEVLATAEGENTHVGDQAGHGISAMRSRRYGRFFPESGWVVSLMSVRPKGMYADQLHRQWLRSVKDDFWQREYEAFGPQAVLTKEVFGNHTVATDVFGYQGRFDEYRRHPSYVTGQFRTLDDDWHLARFFESAPALNNDFITCVPSDRIFADVSEPECRAMISHSIRAKRLVHKRARY